MFDIFGPRRPSCNCTSCEVESMKERVYQDQITDKYELHLVYHIVHDLAHKCLTFGP